MVAAAPSSRGSTFLFGLPGGRCLVGLLGLIVIAVDVHAAVKGVKQDFLPTLRTGAMSSSVRKATTRLGTAAYHQGSGTAGDHVPYDAPGEFH